LNKFTTLVDEKNDRVFIIPIEDKPLKIIFEELPCPICQKIKCEYAKSSCEDLIYKITCKNINNCDKIILDNLIEQ